MEKFGKNYKRNTAATDERGHGSINVISVSGQINHDLASLEDKWELQRQQREELSEKARQETLDELTKRLEQYASHKSQMTDVTNLDVSLGLNSPITDHDRDSIIQYEMFEEGKWSPLKATELTVDDALYSSLSSNFRYHSHNSRMSSAGKHSEVVKQLQHSLSLIENDLLMSRKQTIAVLQEIEEL